MGIPTIDDELKLNSGELIFGKQNGELLVARGRRGRLGSHTVANGGEMVLKEPAEVCGGGRPGMGVFADLYTGNTESTIE